MSSFYPGMILGRCESPTNIEAQEAQGQRKFCEMKALPKECSSKCKAALEKAGIVFGDEVDNLFVRVTLPEGWKVKPTDHHMWNDLIDNDNIVRAVIFYKASGHDRRASVTVRSRYHVNWLYRISGDSNDRAVVTGDAKAGRVLKRFFEYRPGSSNYGVQLAAAKAAAREWLNENYPDHNDPSAYW